LDSATPGTRNEFTADLGSALQLTAEVTVKKTSSARSKIFGNWCRFCLSLGKLPSLRDVPRHEDKISYLLVFGIRYRRHGRGASKKPVRAGTVEDALLAVGKGIADLGEPDPRKVVPGSSQNHPILAAFLKRLRDQDSPANRAYPANVLFLRSMFDSLDCEHALEGQANRSVTDLAILAFFWLLRPAEYLFISDNSESRSQAFRLCDVCLTIDGKLYSAVTAPLNDLNDVARISAATLTFTDQKNAVRGEQIGHAATDDPLLCPCKALGRIVLHLRKHKASHLTPLYTYFDSNNTAQFARPAFVTNALRHAAKHIEATTGIDHMLLSARSLRPGGATALLCAHVDKDAIQLMGRWKSDAMLRYLRIQALVHTEKFGQRMLDHGSYTYAQNVYTDDPDPIPQQAPPQFQALLDHEEIDE